MHLFFHLLTALWCFPSNNETLARASQWHLQQLQISEGIHQERDRKTQAGSGSKQPTRLHRQLPYRGKSMGLALIQPKKKEKKKRLWNITFKTWPCICLFIVAQQHNRKQDVGFVEENLVLCCLDLFLAGSETTSKTLQWGLLYLIKTPHIQGELRSEPYSPTDQITKGRLLHVVSNLIWFAL